VIEVVELHPPAARPYIRLSDGTVVYPDDPLASTPTLAGLLGGVARICRYQGHRPWTVLQHLWLCDELVRHEHHPDREQAQLRLLVLLHDLHEAVVGDIPSPLKPLLGEPFAALEAAWEERVHGLFGIAVPSGEWKDEVKRIDRAALAIEKAAFPLPGDSEPGLDESRLGVQDASRWVYTLRAMARGPRLTSSVLQDVVDDRIRTALAFSGWMPKGRVLPVLARCA